MSDKYEYHEAELAPGTECPLCDDTIISWGAIHVHNLSNVEAKCWIPAEDVKPGRFSGKFEGNIIVINHSFAEA